jgi:hypothetical protein
MTPWGQVSILICLHARTESKIRGLLKTVTKSVIFITTQSTDSSKTGRLGFKFRWGVVTYVLPTNFRTTVLSLAVGYQEQRLPKCESGFYLLEFPRLTMCLLYFHALCASLCRANWEWAEISSVFINETGSRGFSIIKEVVDNSAIV